VTTLTDGPVAAFIVGRLSSARSTFDDVSKEEVAEAWDGPLFERFVRFREILTTGLSSHGEAALRRVPPQPGQRALDIGCGFGDESQRIARMVGPDGDVLGVDVSARFVEACREDAHEAGLTNVRFMAADLQTVDDLGGPYDVAFSRFGTMFFVSPVAGMRNVRRALRPDGRLVMVVWRRREDNDWLYRAQTIVEGIVSRPEEYDEPTCGPGPFALASADRVCDVLLSAGFGDVELYRCDRPIMIGRELEEAIDFVTSLGPAGEILRLQGDRAAHLHGRVRAALAEGLSEFENEDGQIWAPSSTWIVSATAPRG
jgi:ubiquinone/menaquinone biosynthesis C-methylase UbiE